MAKESVKSREERVKNSTSPEELEKLAEDKEVIVRQCVAENENTPVELMEKLAQDKDYDVRYSVTVNPNTPFSLQEKLMEDLVEDKDEDVRKDKKLITT